MKPGSQHEANLEGRILWRGDEGYEAARLDAVWHQRKPRRYPDAVVLARSEEDVAEAVRLASARGLKVKARAGGHSWTASSIRDGGLLIDLAGVREWSLDPVSRTATVAPGTKGRDLNSELAKHDLFFPTGHCPTIAVGGFLLQGGWGWNSRKLGPACMSVIAVDVVTADGEIVHADEESNPELLWAARGAGSGFFGIVTRYSLRCYPRPKAFKLSSYVYPGSAMEEVLHWLRDMQERLPPALELEVYGAYPRDPEGTPVKGADPVLMIFGFALFDTDEEATAALDILESCPARDVALQADVAVPTTLDSLYELIDSMASDDQAYAGDSLWTDAEADELVPAFRRMVMEMPTASSFVLWWPWIPQPFPNAALSISGKTYISPFVAWVDPAEEERYKSWPAEQVGRVEHLSKGIQLADENLIDRPDARYMSDENAARLEELRSQWDPDNRFHTFLFGNGPGARA
jgi:FAD/FMN-containing dehydrogenase